MAELEMVNEKPIDLASLFGREEELCDELRLYLEAGEHWKICGILWCTACSTAKR